MIATDTDNIPPELRVPTAIVKTSSNPIDPALINRIYETQYAQSIKQPDSSKWDFRILFNRHITAADKSSSDGRIHLTHQDKTTSEPSADDFDLIVAATGFVKVSPQSLLSSLISKRLLDGTPMVVNAEYAVNFRRGILEPGVGLWCVGSIGDTEHAVGDGAFRVMAERSARLTGSVMACLKDAAPAGADAPEQVQAQL